MYTGGVVGRAWDGVREEWRRGGSGAFSGSLAMPVDGIAQLVPEMFYY